MNLNYHKKNIVKTAAIAKEGHIPSALSILDILYVLYNKILRISADDSENTERDIFIMSKGHASIGLYVILAEKGFISPEELDNFGNFDSILGGHPDRNKVPGVEASTGSLGHGLPIAVGTALGQKIRNSQARTFVIIGDGEANEGTIWEAALLAAHHNLNNLCCVIDFNHSTDRALEIGDLIRKFESFGWGAVEVDGHNHVALENALNIQHELKPRAIIANTIKGKGIGIMENNPAWHHKFPTEEEIESILSELN